MNLSEPEFCESRCFICTNARKGHWLARILQRMEMLVTFGGCPAGRARKCKYGVGPDKAIPPDMLAKDSAQKTGGDGLL